MNSTSGFISRYRQAAKVNSSLLCVGLDPAPSRFPEAVNGSVMDFCRAIIDVTADLVCAYKLQIAYFSAIGAETDAVNLIDYIHSRYPAVPVILDAKRGDIGTTADQYAREAFERYQADAVTVNPYMGFDTIKPFSDYTDKGVFVLCRTSNPSGAELQDLLVEGRPLYEIVAQKAATDWNENKNLMLVAGATNPKMLGHIRKTVGDMPVLVPGVGAQGGSIEESVTLGTSEDGGNLLINASRGVLYVDKSDNFAQSSRSAAQQLRDEINKFRR